MAEFYVTFDRDDRHFLAIVTAAERPHGLQFASRDSLIETMEGFEQDWQLTSEVELPEDFVPVSDAWLEMMAERGRLKQLPKPQGSRVAGEDYVSGVGF